MIKRFLPFCTCIFLLVQCKQKPSHFLHDHWTMTKDNHQMSFKQNNTMWWVIPGNLTMDTFYAKYKIDDSKSPKWLDLYDFENGLMKGRILAGIYNEISDDTLLLDFKPVDNWADADTSRPMSFSENEKRFLLRKK